MQKRLRLGKVSAALIAALVIIAAASFTSGVLVGNYGLLGGAGTSSVSSHSPTETLTTMLGTTTEAQSTSTPTSTSTHGGEGNVNVSINTNESVTQTNETSTQALSPSVLKLSSYSDLIRMYEEYSSNQRAPWMISPIPLYAGTYSLSTLRATPTTTAAQVKSTATQGASVEYSKTNVQVKGVDEADIVKNDGKYLYIVGRTKWVRPLGKASITSVPVTPVYIVRAYPPSELRVVSKLMINGFVQGIYVWRDELVVINHTATYWPVVIIKPLPSGAGGSPRYTLIIRHGFAGMTNVLVYSVKDRSKPKFLYKDSVSGYYLTSRMINGSLYLLTRYPLVTFWVKEGVLVPEVNGKPLNPSSIGYLNTSLVMPWMINYVTVLGLNLSSGSLSAEAYVMPYPSKVFVSKDSIYLISNSFNYMVITMDIVKHAIIPALPVKVGERVSKIISSNKSLQEKFRLINEELSKYVKAAGVKGATKIVGSVYSYVERNVLWRPLTSSLVIRLKLSDLKAKPVAEGVVPGHVLSQFAMYERGGYFIVATTSTVIKGVRFVGTGWLGTPVITPSITTVNSIYVLNASNLRVVASLRNLAKGESIYAARFVGNYLFLVTYRSIDPLFVINLTNPSKPEVIGYVNSTGFSRYLHPYGNHYLIGVGLETSKKGAPLGVKVTLYDVGNPRRIKVVSTVVIKAPWSTTQVLWNHKAFLINPSKGYIAIPVTMYAKGSVGNYLYIIKISNGSLSVLGKVSQAGVVRAAYIGNYIYAISRDKVTVINSLNMKVVASATLKP